MNRLAKKLSFFFERVRVWMGGEKMDPATRAVMKEFAKQHVLMRSDAMRASSEEIAGRLAELGVSYRSADGKEMIRDTVAALARENEATGNIRIGFHVEPREQTRKGPRKPIKATFAQPTAPRAKPQAPRPQAPPPQAPPPQQPRTRGGQWVPTKPEPSPSQKDQLQRTNDEVDAFEKLLEQTLESGFDPNRHPSDTEADVRRDVAYEIARTADVEKDLRLLATGISTLDATEAGRDGYVHDVLDITGSMDAALLYTDVVRRSTIDDSLPDEKCAWNGKFIARLPGGRADYHPGVGPPRYVQRVPYWSETDFSERALRAHEERRVDFLATRPLVVGYDNVVRVGEGGAVEAMSDKHYETTDLYGFIPVYPDDESVDAYWVVRLNWKDGQPLESLNYVLTWSPLPLKAAFALVNVVGSCFIPPAMLSRKDLESGVNWGCRGHYRDMRLPWWGVDRAEDASSACKIPNGWRSLYALCDWVSILGSVNQVPGAPDLEELVPVDARALVVQERSRQGQPLRGLAYGLELYLVRPTSEMTFADALAARILAWREYLQPIEPYALFGTVGDEAFVNDPPPAQSFDLAEQFCMFSPSLPGVLAESRFGEVVGDT
jgi:hypothetical protein